MALPFKSELDEIKEQVEAGIKESEEKNDPKPALEALSRAIDRAKRKNRLQERISFSVRYLLIQHRFKEKYDAKELIEALKKYIQSLKERKDPKAEEYEEALAVIAALFDPSSVPENAPEKVKKFVNARSNYEAFLKVKHEFMDYSKATLTKTLSDLAESGIIERVLDELEEELKPIVTPKVERRYVYTLTLPDGRMLTLRIREDAEAPGELLEELKNKGIDLSLS